MWTRLDYYIDLHWPEVEIERVLDACQKTTSLCSFDTSLPPSPPPYTDKKENTIFLIYKEIQNGTVAKSYMTITASLYMRKYLRISSYIRKPFLILYMTLQLPHSEFPFIWGQFDFLFLTVCPQALRWARQGKAVCRKAEWPGPIAMRTFYILLVHFYKYREYW